MKVQFTIDLAPTRLVTRWGLLLGVPLALVLGHSAVSWAQVTLKTWKDGETLTAADLNSNFAMLASSTARDTPEEVVGKLNAAVAGGAKLTLGEVTAASSQYDLRWMVQHGAAAAACAAVSPVLDSDWSHVVIPKPGGATCAAACMANGGGRVSCRAAIAIGSILPTRATALNDIVSKNHNYGCDDAQAAYDEVGGKGLEELYTSYCCCYH